MQQEMTAEAGIDHAPSSAPYRRGWLQALYASLDALPGPTWIPVVVFGAVIGATTQVQAWENGDAGPGQLNVPTLYWTFMAISLLWCVGYFQRLAGRAFDAFRPAFAGSDAVAARLRYELVVIPARGSALILAAAAGLTLAAFTFAPRDAGIVGVSPPTLVAALITQTLAAGVLFTLGYQVLRQMRLVRAAMAAASVDLFHPAPLQALSRLTAASGIALVIVVGASTIFVPPPPDLGSLLLNWAPFLILPPVIAAIAFVVPLSGMHERLDVEKGRLLAEADQRLKALLADLNGDVDAGDLSRADGLGKTLTAMLQQRELLSKLPTWPWSTGTFRAFVTAILLPVFLFLIQRLLLQVTG